MPVTKASPATRRRTASTKSRKSLVAEKVRDREVMRKLIKQYKDAMRQSRRIGRAMSFRVDVGPEADEPVVSPIEVAPASEAFPVESAGEPSPELQAALKAARLRGRVLAADVLGGDDMLNADAFAKLIGTTRATVNAKRQNGQLIGLDGAKRGFRFPTWQLDSDGRPYAAIPQLFERLGKNSWAVYRFLTSPHNELNGRTGLDVLRSGEPGSALDVAESISRGDFR